MHNKYLRAFVIGSSFLVFAPYFYAVSNFKDEKFNYDYKRYTFGAPIFLGFMNMLSLFIAEKFKISKTYRFLLISIISATIVLLTIIYFKIYNYTPNEWVNHIIQMYCLYFFTFNFIVFTIDMYI